MDLPLAERPEIGVARSQHAARMGMHRADGPRIVRAHPLFDGGAERI